ncbi:MAG: energy-coupling factor ABC transporter permease [Pseudomonadota bacterium]|nr:energy-coupling factor ABC transporter permease [Pseudomonadota bacterium]
MFLSDSIVPAGAQWASMIVFVPVLAGALYFSPWRRLVDSEQLNVFLGACVSLLVLWTMRAGVMPGLNFQILGVATLTLMFGGPLAFLGVTIVIAGTTWNADGAWSLVPLNALVSGGVPILVTNGMLWLARRRLPRNYFVYVFINAFLAAGVGAAGVVLLSAAIMVLAGTHTADAVAYGFLPYTPMIFFAEAMMNGMLMAIFAAYRPGWVVSFDDRLYLAR